MILGLVVNSPSNFIKLIVKDVNFEKKLIFFESAFEQNKFMKIKMKQDL